MRRFVPVIISIAFVFSYWACKNNSSNPTNSGTTGGNYFPLAVGNHWEYNRYSLDSNGAIIQSSLKKEYDTVDATITIGGRAAYKMVDNITPPTILTYDASGNLLYFQDTSQGQGKGYWAVFMLFSNNTANNIVLFDQQDSAYDHLPLTEDTYYGATPVTVPAGAFNAAYHKDVFTNSTAGSSGLNIYTDVTQSYYASGVGLVEGKDFYTTVIDSSGVSMKNYGGTGGTYIELVSYSVQ